MDLMKTGVVGDDNILQLVKHGQGTRMDGVETGDVVDDDGCDGGG